MDYISYIPPPDAGFATSPILLRLIWHTFFSVKIGRQTFQDESGRQTTKTRFFMIESGKIYLGSSYTIMNGASREVTEYRDVAAWAANLSKFRPTSEAELKSFIDDCLRKGWYTLRSHRRIGPEATPVMIDLDICLTSDLTRTCLWDSLEFSSGVPYIPGGPLSIPKEKVVRERWTHYHPTKVIALPENAVISVKNLPS